jgi:uroporphyrin-III C-methyltransferase
MIAGRLIAAGRSAFTPVLTVENAGAPDARLIATTLDGLARDGVAGSGGPLLIIVGDVAARAEAALPVIEEARLALCV